MAMKLILIFFFFSTAIAANGNGVKEAKLVIDGKDKRSYKSGFVVVSKHQTGGADYLWLTIHLYAFELSQFQLQSAKVGNFESINAQVHKAGYNTSHAKLILSYNKKMKKATQLDISFPGRSCTAAPYKKVDAAIGIFRFENNKVSLKSSGTVLCGYKSKTQV